MSILRNALGCFSLLIGAMAILAAAPSVVRGVEVFNFVNTLQGTNSSYERSYANTLPVVAMPWGMTNWAPQTSGGGWWFQYDAKNIRGIRATRQPSPWMGDYGQFLLMPQTGPLITGAEARQSPYSRQASSFAPDYLKLDLPRYKVQVELTASDRCAVLRMTFRSGNTGRLIVDPAETSHVEFFGRTIRGYSTATSGNSPPKFKAYFVIQLDREITHSGTFHGSNRNVDRPAGDGHSQGEYVEFNTAPNRTVVALMPSSPMPSSPMPSSSTSKGSTSKPPTRASVKTPSCSLR